MKAFIIIVSILASVQFIVMPLATDATASTVNTINNRTQVIECSINDTCAK